MKKIGFTLAEVLITLGIIGVVAAMTLPALITKHDKNVTVTSLRKFHTTLSQAKLRSEVDNGEMSAWDFPEYRNIADFEKFFDKYFRPYMTVINQCKSSDNCRSLRPSLNPVYTLKDGMQFEFSPTTKDNISNKGAYIYIVVDINGSKAPNKAGRDIFYMDIFPKHNAVMLGQMSDIDINRNLKREDFINGVSINSGTQTACCNKNSCATAVYQYYACGALIQADGWQIKDDYPW